MYEGLVSRLYLQANWIDTNGIRSFYRCTNCSCRLATCP